MNTIWIFAECHTEKTSTKRFTKILPLGLWSKEQGSHNSLTLHIRGTGVAVIPLIKLPGTATCPKHPLYTEATEMFPMDFPIHLFLL
jgi:hypothetical protein